MLELLSVAAISYSKNAIKENQDSILPPKRIDKGYLFAIADGVGSYSGAKLASNTAISYLNQINSSKHFNDINLIFNEIKEAISNLSIDNISLSKAATTLTFCFINELGINIGHIGDCRLYIRIGNKLIKLTKDHTQHQVLLDEKVYTAQELKKMPGKNILTTAISKYINMEYEFVFIPFSDLLIEENSISLYAMSDGAYHFWDKRKRFSEGTMKNIPRFVSSLQKRIERNMPIDDYSIVAVEFFNRK